MAADVFILHALIAMKKIYKMFIAPLQRNWLGPLDVPWRLILTHWKKKWSHFDLKSSSSKVFLFFNGQKKWWGTLAKLGDTCALASRKFVLVKLNENNTIAVSGLHRSLSSSYHIKYTPEYLYLGKYLAKYGEFFLKFDSFRNNFYVNFTHRLPLPPCTALLPLRLLKVSFSSSVSLFGKKE